MKQLVFVGAVTQHAARRTHTDLHTHTYTHTQTHVLLQLPSPHDAEADEGCACGCWCCFILSSVQTGGNRWLLIFVLLQALFPVSSGLLTAPVS